jgi:CRISPR-associated protein Cas2
MTVFVLSRVTQGLRGALTRWLLELSPGVFVGTISARVRERLWSLIQSRRRLGACTLIARVPNEQGFTIQAAGDSRRNVRDFDGLQLISFGDKIHEPLPGGSRTPVNHIGEACGGDAPSGAPVETGKLSGDG